MPGSLDGVDVDAIYDNEECAYEWTDDFYRKPNNGTIEKTDKESVFAEDLWNFSFSTDGEKICSAALTTGTMRT